jgi:hypothetical protein
LKGFELRFRRLVNCGCFVEFSTNRHECALALNFRKASASPGLGAIGLRSYSKTPHEGRGCKGPTGGQIS